MNKSLPQQGLRRLRTAGLVLPRAPRPGERWAPRTDAEAHLLREAQRLDHARQVLLAELGRLRVNGPSRAGVLDETAQRTERLRECPLTPMLLAVIDAAAAGESQDETASRLKLTYQTIKSHRSRALSRLQARNIVHAVALCVEAGWVVPRRTPTGVGR